MAVCKRSRVHCGRVVQNGRLADMLFPQFPHESRVLECVPLFPKMSRRDRTKIVYESCARMVEMALFVVASPHMSVKRLSNRVKISDTVRSELQKLSDDPFPLVLMIPHFAMMETITMFPLLVKNVKIPKQGFYRPFNSSGMEEWIKRAGRGSE